MTNSINDRIHTSVETKLNNLNEWVETALPEEKFQCLCSDEDTHLHDHIDVMDQTLEKSAQGTLGICQVCHTQIEPGVLEVDYTASICLDCLSEAQRRELEMELEFSSEVQRAMLPQQAPSVSGLEIGAFSRPAQIIGGDYFDFIDFKNGGHGLVVADVMGHGVSASLIMSGLQAALRTLIPEADSPGDVMERVNKYYLHNINLTTFITTFLARFDPGNGALTYCNAGHNPPMLLTPLNGAGYTTSWMKPTAAAIGIMEDFSSGMESITMKKGNVLVIYTDGLTEAVNSQGEPFGPGRLEQTARAHAPEPAQEIISAIRADLNTFTGGGPLADDITTVVCKILD